MKKTIKFENEFTTKKCWYALGRTDKEAGVIWLDWELNAETLEKKIKRYIEDDKGEIKYTIVKKETGEPLYIQPRRTYAIKGRTMLKLIQNIKLKEKLRR